MLQSCTGASSHPEEEPSSERLPLQCTSASVLCNPAFNPDLPLEVGNYQFAFRLKKRAQVETILTLLFEVNALRSRLIP